MPVIDECTQDWTLLSAEIGTDSLVFEAERSLETDDSQDRAFVDDTAEGETFAASTENTPKVVIRLHTLVRNNDTALHIDGV